MNTRRWILRRIGWTWSAALLALMLWVVVAQAMHRPLPVNLFVGLVVVGLAVDTALSFLIEATNPDTPRLTGIQWTVDAIKSLLSLVAGSALLVVAYLLVNPDMAAQPTEVGLMVIAGLFGLARLVLGISTRHLFPPESRDEDEDDEKAEIMAEGRWS